MSSSTPIISNESMGRSSSRGKRGEKRPCRVQGWLPKELNDELDAQCQERGITRSAAVLEAMEAWAKHRSGG